MKETRKYILLITLLGILFGVIRYQMVVQFTDGVFFFPVEDSYIILRYTEKIIEGHPFRINRDDKPTIMDPSPIVEFIYAFGYLVGFKSPEALSFYAFWINILFLSFSLLFIFWIGVFLNLSLNESLILALFSLLFNPFRYNFTTILGYGIMTLSFYLFIYLFLKRKKIFILPAIIFSLSRPETPLILIIFLLYSIYVEKSKKDAVLISISFFTGILFPLFLKIITGSLIPSGFIHQFILDQYGISGGVRLILKYFIDYFKGVVLGYYPSPTKTSSLITYFNSQFPVFYFVFIFLGIYWIIKENFKYKKFIFLLIVVFFIEFFISSLTIFQGVHLLRHTAWLLPLFFLIGIYGINYFVQFIKIQKKYIFAFYSFYLLILSVDHIIYISSVSINLTLPHYEASKWIEDNLKGGKFMALLDSRIDFFTKVKHYPLSSGENWRYFYYGRPIKNYAYPFELFNYELKKDDKWYLFYSREDISTINALLFPSLIDSMVYERQYISGNYFKIGVLNTSLFLNSKRPIIKTNLKILDEINPGDPISEKLHKYESFIKTDYGKVKPLPQIGKIKLKEKTLKMIEGGYLSEYESFIFKLNTDQRDSVYLIGRFASILNLGIYYPDFSTLTSVTLSEQKIRIYLNDSLIVDTILKNLHGFTEHIFYLPKKFIKNKNKIKVLGTHLPLHWWIAEKSK